MDLNKILSYPQNSKFWDTLYLEAFCFLQPVAKKNKNKKYKLFVLATTMKNVKQ